LLQPTSQKCNQLGGGPSVQVPSTGPADQGQHLSLFCYPPDPSVSLPGHLSPSAFQKIHVAHLQASPLVPPLRVLIEGWGSAQLVEMPLHQGHHMLQLGNNHLGCHL